MDLLLVHWLDGVGQLDAHAHCRCLLVLEPLECRHGFGLALSVQVQSYSSDAHLDDVLPIIVCSGLVHGKLHQPIERL